MRDQVRHLQRRMVDETLIPSRDDVLFMAEWPVLRFAAAFLPERAWFDVAMRVEQAKVLLGFRDSAATAETIRRALGVSDNEAARNIASRVAAHHTEQSMQVFKSRGDGWTPEIQIEGREHLEAAVARGKGTILWQAPFSFAGLVIKIGMKAVGRPVTHTGLATHGFSYGPFATRFLNPQVIRAENQYVRQRITIDPENPGAALLRARRELSNNGVVVINMGAWAGRAATCAPLLGSWLPLAVGAPGLAQRSGATLLPVFTTRLHGTRTFLIRIGPPLPTGAENSAKAIRDSVAALAPQLEEAVRGAPDQWVCWENLRGMNMHAQFADPEPVRALDAQGTL